TQVVNPVGGGGIDTSPAYYKGELLVGTTGGDWGGACEMVALNAKTGKVLWHYSSIPSNPSAYGWNTWPANRWYYGGGAIWDMPAVDPTLNLVYLGTGNPLPFNGLINPLSPTQGDAIAPSDGKSSVRAHRAGTTR